MTYHIYSIGNALVDQLYEIEDDFLQAQGINKSQRNLINEAELAQRLDALHQQGTRAALVGGGSAANSMATAALLGAKVFYSCAVADDENGRFFLQDLKVAGIDSNECNVQASGVTGTCVVLVTPDAERTMNTCLGVACDLDKKVVDEQALAKSDIIFLEGYMATSQECLETAKHLFDHAKQHDKKRVLTFSDPALVDHFNSELHELLSEQVDLLFCNEEEALIYTGEPLLEHAFEALKKTAVQFVITQGAKGALAWDGEQSIQIDAYPVKALDTVGAGDAFAGAFTYGLAMGHSFAESGKLASKTAAEVVSRFGARLNYDEYEQLKDVL